MAVDLRRLLWNHLADTNVLRGFRLAHQCRMIIPKTLRAEAACWYQGEEMEVYGIFAFRWKERWWEGRLWRRRYEGMPIVDSLSLGSHQSPCETEKKLIASVFLPRGPAQKKRWLISNWRYHFFLPPPTRETLSSDPRWPNRIVPISVLVSESFNKKRWRRPHVMLLPALTMLYPLH